jgi:hypothetical protein
LVKETAKVIDYTPKKKLLVDKPKLAFVENNNTSKQLSSRSSKSRNIGIKLKL